VTMVARRILVVEDDDDLALSVRVGLEAAGYEAECARDGRGFAELLDRFHPDLVALDVSLPEGPDGFELARVLRARSATPLLFITASDQLTDRLSGFDVGADDYLVKPFALAELLARVRAVLRRAGRTVSGSLEVRDFVIDDVQRTVTRAGRPVPLTTMEFELFATLARAPGRVFSKSQLLAFVWGFGDFDPNLVEVHVSSLRRKLAADGPPLIHTERSKGYVLRP